MGQLSVIKVNLVDDDNQFLDCLGFFAISVEKGFYYDLGGVMWVICEVRLLLIYFDVKY